MFETDEKCSYEKEGEVKEEKDGDEFGEEELMKIAENEGANKKLASIIEKENLNVKTNTGGYYERTNRDIAQEIIEARRLMRIVDGEGAKKKLAAIIQEEKLDVKTNTGGPSARTNEDIASDIIDARKAQRAEEKKRK